MSGRPAGTTGQWVVGATGPSAGPGGHRGGV